MQRLSWEQCVGATLGDQGVMGERFEALMDTVGCVSQGGSVGMARAQSQAKRTRVILHDGNC